jgi:multiple sugar transport system substrate-binding protein
MTHPSPPSRRTVLAAGAAAAAGLAGLASAGAARAGTGAKRTLTVAAFPNVDAIVRAAAPAWRLRHPDVEIEVVSRQYADHHTAMTTALSTAVRLPDVMVLESTYVGRFEQGEGLDDLNRAPYDVGRFRDRFVRFAWDQATNGRGEQVALPTDIGPGTLLYRKDLLDKARVPESELLPTWEAYIAAGARIKAATGAFLIGNAQMLKDILIRSGVGPGEGLYFDHQSRVLVEQPRFHRAFELCFQLRRHQLDARVTDWSNEWAEGLRRGNISTLLTGAWMAGQLANWVAPATRGLWRAAPLPENTFVSYGGSFYALPRHADPDNKALAWELVQMLTLDRDRQLAALKSEDAFPALLAAQDDPFFEEPLPFLGGQRARPLWREAARRCVATEVHKQNNFADEVVNAELGNVLDRGKPIDLALADAKRLLERRAHR